MNTKVRTILMVVLLLLVIASIAVIGNGAGVAVTEITKTDQTGDTFGMEGFEQSELDWADLKSIEMKESEGNVVITVKTVGGNPGVGGEKEGEDVYYSLIFNIETESDEYLIMFKYSYAAVEGESSSSAGPATLRAAAEVTLEGEGTNTLVLKFSASDLDSEDTLTDISVKITYGRGELGWRSDDSVSADDDDDDDVDVAPSGPCGSIILIIVPVLCAMVVGIVLKKRKN